MSSSYEYHIFALNDLKCYSYCTYLSNWLMSSDKLILVCSTSWLAWSLCLQKSFSCVSNCIDVRQFSWGILHLADQCTLSLRDCNEMYVFCALWKTWRVIMVRCVFGDLCAGYSSLSLLDHVSQMLFCKPSLSFSKGFLQRLQKITCTTCCNQVVNIGKSINNRIAVDLEYFGCFTSSLMFGREGNCWW